MIKIKVSVMHNNHILLFIIFLASFLLMQSISGSHFNAITSELDQYNDVEEKIKPYWKEKNFATSMLKSSFFSHSSNDIGKNNFTFYVDDNAPSGWYDATHVHTISEAVNNASEQDSIFVYDGIYEEYVHINTSVSIIGQSTTEVLVSSSNQNGTIKITTDFVSIKNMTVSNPVAMGIKMIASSITVQNITLTGSLYGVYAANASECSLSNNTLYNNTNGVYFYDTDDCLITNNSFANNSYRAVAISSASTNIRCENNSFTHNEISLYLSSSTECYIQHNTIKNSTDKALYVKASSNCIISNNVITYNHHGIYLDISTDNSIISLNTIENNTVRGVFIKNSPSNAIQHNNIKNNYDGIGLFYSSYTLITQNTISQNDNDGIRIKESTQNNIRLNTIKSNYRGCYIYQSSTHNAFTENTIINNSKGIYIEMFEQTFSSSTNNWFFHNSFMNNSIHAFDSWGNNWNKPYAVGGNYWDDYNGSDFFHGINQDIPGSDGFGDGDYNKISGIVDNFPLITPWNGSLPDLTFDVIYVDDDFNQSTPGWWYDHFSTIHNGSAAADEYATIHVYPGLYKGNLSVTKPLSIIGANQTTTIINCDENTTILQLKTNSIRLSNFTITSNNYTNQTGIFIKSQQNYLSNLTVQHCNKAIEVDFPSKQNILRHLNITNNEIGIWLQESSYNIIEHNKLLFQNQSAILIFDAHHNDISNNIIHETENVGINCSASCYNSIGNNSINSNGIGIDFIRDNQYNIITNNTIEHNMNAGIYIQNESNNNTIYNNIFNNTCNALDTEVNQWNRSIVFQKNCIGGPYLGGNYWQDYIGSDQNGDGLGDTFIPYNASSHIVHGGDFLPLTQGPYGLRFINLTNKWQFISSPFNSTINLNELFIYKNKSNSWQEATTNQNPSGSPLIDSNIFGWDRNNQIYLQSSQLLPHHGYWLYSFVNCTLGSQRGNYPSSINSSTLLQQKWNTIGIKGNKTIDNTMLLIRYNNSFYNWTEATTADNPTNAPLIDPNFFGWNSINQYYSISSQLNPGESYWVYVYTQCELIQHIN